MTDIVERVAAEVRRQLGIAESGPCSSDTCSDCPNFTGCRGAAEVIQDRGADRVGCRPGVGALPASLAGAIDHTLLKPEATREDVIALCKEAKKHGFASVCVNPTWIRLARSILDGTGVMTVAVIGFPLGSGTASAKAFEARDAARAGAQELDMVLNIGALRSGDYRTVEDDIRRVVEASRPIPVKVILETSKLTDEEKVIGSALSKLAGAAFVKTSTGFGGGGATVDDITLMRRVVGAELGVKASGGVRTEADAQNMMAAGATRLGASASVAIVTGKKASKGGY